MTSRFTKFHGGSFVAIAVALMAAPAAAQTTGTDALEEIVVTAVRAAGISGIDIPDTSKAKATLTAEAIQKQTAGQSILNTINMLPGVSFQNNDGYGSAGGTLNIRGFDSSRISLTWDGMPLNDSGNYAIYSNQMLDPEVIDKVTVNLGSTDVDSPTASAAGGTVAYQTRLPSEEMGALVSASIGQYNFHRLFAVIDTGAIGPWGTRAFFSASGARNDNPFNNIGKVDKQQYNGRIYQPIGDNGDFISIAGHFNRNRNNFFGSVPLRTDLATPNGFPTTTDGRKYVIAQCTVADARPGVADVANSCGSTYDERMNPSDTGNIRGQSRFTLTDGLILTVDPSYQYVKANGGGTVVAREGTFGVGGTQVTGYINGTPYAGVDLNGDGDKLDTVRVLAPSQTQTHRYGVAASLIYEINDQNRVRIAYTLDHARHRQTGEVDFIGINGQTVNPFPSDSPILDAAGNPLQKRDRLSYAILNQVSGEYLGRFMDDRLIVNVGLRAPFFKRDLTQNCFTTNASGSVTCFSGNSAAETLYAAANPTYVGPTSKVFNYSRLLPNLGFNFNFAGDFNLFANYSKNISVPGTDNLYNAFWFRDAAGSKPDPETTDSFDLGVRYAHSDVVVAQLAGWFTKFHNRLASAYDVDLNQTVYRNLGNVDKYGIDGSVAWRPMKEVTLYGFASWQKSKIADDVEAANIGGVVYYAPTAGKRESGAPDWTVGGRLEGNFGPLSGGVQVKYTGKRFIYDTNLPIYTIVSGATAQLYDATAPGYTLTDLDLRFSMEQFGLKKTYFQFNVTNLFDKVYVGGFGGNLTQTVTRNASGVVTGFGSAPFVQIGAPRTISGTFVIGF